MENEYEERVSRFVELIKSCKGSIVVFTGAGISTSADIPDYRGTYGLWTKLAQNSETKNKLVTEEEVNKRAASAKLRLPQASYAKPTFTHMALKVLVDKNYIRHVVSQNVDGLHLRSGLKRENLSEFHGNLFIEQCNSCGLNVFRNFDVAETTGRSQHITGRICPKCRILFPTETSTIDTALHSARTMLLARSNKRMEDLDAEKQMKLYRKAAQITYRQFEYNNKQCRKIMRIENAAEDDTDSNPSMIFTTTLVESKDIVNRVPLLRDTIVNYFEKQHSLGLNEIYRVQSALEAIHGTRCMSLIHKVSSGRLFKQSSKSRKRRKLQAWLKVSAWDQFWNEKMRYVNEFIMKEKFSSAEGSVSEEADSMSCCSISTSDSDEDEIHVMQRPWLEPATLIIVLGSSLSVLKHYKFLWPIGLGKRGKRKADGETTDENSRVPPGCALVINTLTPTCKDGSADILFREPCDQLLARIMTHLGLNVPEYDAEIHDQLLRWAKMLPENEIPTKTRPIIFNVSTSKQ